MKIALVNTMTPFVRGGAEILVDDLRGQLAERGHQVELFRLPFPNDYAVGLPELVLASKLLDFSSYDRVIAFKFPAYCVCHRHRTLWLFHQFRQVYDLFDKQDGLPRTTENEAADRPDRQHGYPHSGACFCQRAGGAEPSAGLQRDHLRDPSAAAAEYAGVPPGGVRRLLLLSEQGQPAETAAFGGRGHALCKDEGAAGD